MSDDPVLRPIAENRKARHRFKVLDTLECGIELVGSEVKSLRAGQCSLQEAYGKIEGGQLTLVGAHVPEYANASWGAHPPVRDRRLLAHRREIAKWEKQVREKGKTLVPLRVYLKGHLVKVEMGLVEGKKLYDKRAQTKEREVRREIERATRRRR